MMAVREFAREGMPLREHRHNAIVLEELGAESF
jgi:hypothetical protein